MFTDLSAKIANAIVEKISAKLTGHIDKKLTDLLQTIVRIENQLYGIELALRQTRLPFSPKYPPTNPYPPSKIYGYTSAYGCPTPNDFS